MLPRCAGEGLERPASDQPPRSVEPLEERATGVEHVTEAKARWSGHRLLAELNVAVEPTLTVDRGHAIADDVHRSLLHEVPRLAEVMVHVDPHGHEPHGPKTPSRA